MWWKGWSIYLDIPVDFLPYIKSCVVFKKSSLMAISFQKYYRNFSNKAISFNEILECNDKDTRKQQKRHINIETKMTPKRKFPYLTKTTATTTTNIKFRFMALWSMSIYIWQWQSNKGPITRKSVIKSRMVDGKDHSTHHNISGKLNKDIH